MKKYNFKKGFSTAEIVIVVAIIGAVTVVMGSFQRDIFFFNSISQDNLAAQMDGRRGEKLFTAAMRQAAPSALGAYPIVQASSTSITFYADVDNDGVEEQIRYFLSGTNFRRGVVVPTGNPLTYNQANETLTTIVPNVTNGFVTPVFEYYDSSYAGTTTPLTAPINTLSIRLVKLQLLIDKNTNRTPSALMVTTQVTLRNLKDNL